MRTQRFVIVGDSHGDMADPDAVAEFFDFLEDYKPDIRIHLGDAFDLRALRRGASDVEAAESIEADVDAGIEFMRRLDPQVWLLGNHDDRLPRLIHDSPRETTRHYASMVWNQICDSIPANVKTIGYNVENGLCRLGDMVLLHGYVHNMATARTIAMQYGGEGIRRVVQGHVHAFSSHTARMRSQTEGRTIGGLCRRVMDYNRARPATMSHENGWAYGEIRGGRSSFNEYHVETKREQIYVVE